MNSKDLSIDNRIYEIEDELKDITKEIKPSLNSDEKNPISFDRYKELTALYIDLQNELDDLRRRVS